MTNRNKITQAEYWKEYNNNPGWEKNNPIAYTLGSLHIRWADHPTVEVNQGVKKYICHPYKLTTSDMEDFIELKQKGFKVKVNGNTHYGWGTIRVEIWKESKLPPAKYSHKIEILVNHINDYPNCSFKAGFLASQYPQFKSVNEVGTYLNRASKYGLIKRTARGEYASLGFVA